MRRNLFTPGKVFKLSRSKVDLFLQCPLCFYMDCRLGISRPPSPPMTLNNAVDTLLKREFDVYRSRGLPHPLMTAFGVAAVPYQHPDLDIWRSHFKGVFYLHERINLLVHGAPDDVWESNNSLHVVDYKATSTEKQINLEAPWKQPYKRQAESYQWLLRRNGFAVSDTAYFVFVNADKSKPAFDSRLDFSCQILPYAGARIEEPVARPKPTCRCWFDEEANMDVQKHVRYWLFKVFCLKFQFAAQPALDFRDGQYMLRNEKERLIHPLEYFLLITEPPLSGDWIVDVQQALGVSRAWVDGFLKGYSGAGSPCDDDDYLAGFRCGVAVLEDIRKWESWKITLP